MDQKHHYYLGNNIERKQSMLDQISLDASHWDRDIYHIDWYIVFDMERVKWKN